MKIETLQLYSRIARKLKNYNPDVIDNNITWIVRDEDGNIFMIQISGEENYSLYIFELIDDEFSDTTQIINGSKILEIIRDAYYRGYSITRSII